MSETDVGPDASADSSADVPTDDLPVPEEYDEASYRAGYARAMEQIGHAAFEGAAAIAPDDGVPPDDDDETCPECGQPMIAALGGYVCLNCDDTDE